MTVPADKNGLRDKESTRIRLVDSVGALLAREGFGALGVNAVAREAGVDKVLIYRYFGGMDELLLAFGQSGDFWPSIAEVIGDDPSELMTLSPGDRWAKGLSRYARELRRRPVTKEILAWEQIEQNELTAILQKVREEWFIELMTYFPDDSNSIDADLVTTILLLVGAIHYFVVRSRVQADFSGVAIDTDEGWQHLDEVISTICQRTLAPDHKS